MKRGKTLNKISRNAPGWLLMAPTIVLFFCLSWRPIIVAFSYSFYDIKNFEPVKFVGFENFRQILTDTKFLKTLWNTAQYVLWSLLIGLPLPFLTAVAINEMIKSKSFFRVVTYLPALIPGMAVFLIWRFIYNDGSIGLLNSIRWFFGLAPTNWLSNPDLTIPLIVIMMSWNGFGGTVIMYLATLQGVDQSLYEAAELDGAGIFSKFKAVLLPHTYGTLALCFVRQIISVAQVTEQPMVMTGGGPNYASMSLGLTNYYYAFKYGQMEKSMALGVVTFLILLGLTFLYFKMDKKINE